ncbi:MAG TPA: IS110 family transposase [Firmicutes bacterium]|nr:IS110 family transposase [Bacillota bacterium]
MTFVAKIGCFSRFKNPRQLMAHAGLVPREYSSGSAVRQGSITKTGNDHLRRISIECPWSYRQKPFMSQAMQKQQEGQLANIQAMAWKAQVRLCKKYFSRLQLLRLHESFLVSFGRLDVKWKSKHGIRGSYPGSGSCSQAVSQGLCFLRSRSDRYIETLLSGRRTLVRTMYRGFTPQRTLVVRGSSRRKHVVR